MEMEHTARLAAVFTGHDTDGSGELCVTEPARPSARSPWYETSQVAYHLCVSVGVGVCVRVGLWVWVWVVRQNLGMLGKLSP